MIWLYLLLSVLVLTAISVTCTLCFGLQKNIIMRRIILIGVILCMAMSIVSGLIVAGYAGTTNRLQAQYDTLSLYYNTVNNSSNEYVRYDYYNRVKAYNNEFENSMIAASDPWFGALYPANWNVNMGPIAFELHGD